MAQSHQPLSLSKRFFASSFAANNAEAKGSLQTPEILATLVKGSLSLTEKQPGAPTLG